MAMTPQEFWRLYYSKIDRNTRSAGKLTADDAEELLEMLNKSKAEDE